MNKRIILAIVAVMVVLGAGLASAHVGTKPSLTCNQVSTELTSFPSGSHTVTFVVTVNGTTTNVDSSFTGTSGTASADISSLTGANGLLNISAYAQWTDDGGGQTESQEVNLVCHTAPTPPVTTTTPPITTTSSTPVTSSPEIPAQIEGK